MCGMIQVHVYPWCVCSASLKRKVACRKEIIGHNLLQRETWKYSALGIKVVHILFQFWSIRRLVFPMANPVFAMALRCDTNL